MPDAPLIGPYQPDDVLAWTPAGPRSAGRFLSDVTRLAESLPDRRSVLNLLTSRYDFLVGFAAAMLRGQVTLLPQSRAPQTLRRLAGDYPETYGLTDPGDRAEGIESVEFTPQGGPRRGPADVPRVPLDRVVAVAFTSGSTGQPTPHAKTWRALTSVALATGARLGIKAGERLAVAATVPHQHMFGLEASVMLPLMHGLTLHSERPLFPEDLRQALSEMQSERMLVTTPLHIRACVTAAMRLPPLRLVLSATAPLGRPLAQAAERQFHTSVHEIFGFAEAGSIAERRTVAETHWRLLDGVSLTEEGGRWTVQAKYLPAPVVCPDRITVEPEGRFVVHGRAADQVNIAGHRASLGELNQRLMEVDGVRDGVFFLPDDDTQEAVTRLMAFAVAPEKTAAEILQALRAHLDPVFLPRPLILVPRLPRNETGKLTREALLRLAEQSRPEPSDAR